MNIARVRGWLRRKYVAETRGFVFTSDTGIALVLFIVGFLAVFALVGKVAQAASTYFLNRDGVEAVDTLRDHLSMYTSQKYARVFAAKDSAGAVNCTNGWCNEIAFYNQEANNADRYTAFDYANGHVQEYMFTSLAADGTHNGLVAVGAPLSIAGFRVHDVTASQLSTDADNDVSSFMSALWSAAGMTPQDVTVNYGKPFTIGENDAAIVQMWSTTTGDTVSFGPITLPSTNLTITAGLYKPTPAPSVAISVSTVVYHWPGEAAGYAGDPSPPPATFNVSETQYHDPFFAEINNCGGIAAVSPQYIPGSSPTYYPSSMWGQTGPWVYPNPNPTSPPGQNSGPASFGVLSAAAGLCSFGIYDVYTDRSSASADAAVPVQVMGPLQLNAGGGWASTVSLAFNTPTSAAQGVSAGKTYDAAQLTPSYGGNCAGLASAATTGYSTQSAPGASYTIATFNVAPAGATGGGTCTLQVSNQYNDPPTIVNVSVAGGLFVGDGSLNPVGSVTLASNGSGGWVPQTLYLWKKFLASAFSGSVNYSPAGYNSCSGYAYLGSAPSMGSSSANGSSQDVPFTIYGSANTFGLSGKSCSMAFADNFGETTQLAVVVDPQPTPTPAPNAYYLKEVWINNSTGTPTTYTDSSTVTVCANDPAQGTMCGTAYTLEPPGDVTFPATATNCAAGCVQKDYYWSNYSSLCHCYVQKASHSIVETDTYEQYGFDATTNGTVGYYHYPLAAGDMNTSWCQSVTGSNGSTPCTDSTSYNIPGVWYPNPSSKPTL